MWVPASEDELFAALAEGVVCESPYFDVKEALPRAGKNKDLAKDICAMTVDGGVLLYGVGGSDPTRPTKACPFELAGVAERIDQVAQTGIAEPPQIEIRDFASEQESGKGYLAVVIPPSPRAPHMLILDGDNRYWGRGQTGNRILQHREALRHAVDKPIRDRGAAPASPGSPCSPSGDFRKGFVDQASTRLRRSGIGGGGEACARHTSVVAAPSIVSFLIRDQRYNQWMATFDQEQSWPRWSGTIAQLHGGVEQAVTELRKWTGEDPKVSIRVVERDGLTIQMDQADELPDALKAQDLSRINTLSIDVGEYSLPRVQIWLNRGREGDGLTLGVAGSDKTRVNGLASGLGAALKPRDPVGLPWLYGFRLFVVLGAAILTTMVGGALLASTLLDTQPSGVKVAISLGSAAVVGGVLLFAAWAGPTMEILETGQQSRYVQWRAWVRNSVGVLVIGIAASILGAVLFTGD